VAVCLAACGCANTIDTLSSRKFRHNFWERPYDTLFVTPDPVTVLRTSDDGEERAKALRRLKEPRQNGGTDAQQDEAIQFLTTAAVNDPRAVCRLAAIQALGTYTDPRAVQVLEAAYEGVTPDPSGKPGKHGFPPEEAAVIRCRAVASLGQTGQPAAVAVLARAANAETPENTSETEKQELRDVRVAAVRALGNFPANYQAATALVQVLRDDRAVALRHRANDSLVSITGKDLPPDPEQWQVVLQQSGGNLTPPEPDVIRQVGGWFKP
jgi:hypothetical protein